MSQPLRLEQFKKENGVYILSERNNDFEEFYIKVREKEKRIYSDAELGNLPFATESNPHILEWKLRAKSFIRFNNYLGKKKQSINILDLGCGNGWFSGQLSKTFNHKFYCVDINQIELEQARRVFNSDNLNFLYADIFTETFQENTFDLIIVNAAIQYFPVLKRLIKLLLSLLKMDGEIHFVDSPIYLKNEVGSAKKRTMDYYNSIGFPEMSNKYFHHSWNELSEFNSEIIFNPTSIVNKFKQLIFIKDSPFPWVKISL